VGLSRHWISHSGLKNTQHPNDDFFIFADNPSTVIDVWTSP
jgi:hypothetical protein